FLGKAYDPYTLFPDGDDMDMSKMDRIKVDDLKLRPEVFALRLQRRAKLRDALNAGMQQIDQAVADFKLNEYYDRALSLIVSGRAREAFNLQAESLHTRDPDGRDHWPYCYTAVLAGAGIRRGHVHGQSDKTGSAPLSDPVHPGELLASIYHALGIDPATIVYNHLNQPRELVKADALTRLFA